MAVNGQAVKDLVESLGVKQACRRLAKLIETSKIRPEQFSLRELAEAFCGRDWVRRLNPGNVSRFGHLDILEAGGGDAVDVTAFSNITGQIIYSKIHQGWDEADEGLDQLFDEVDTVFDGEKIPGIGQIKGEGESIRPGMPYPESNFGEHYWETPTTTKHGLIVSMTKEAVYFDRTNLILRRAQDVGKRLRTNKLKRQIAVIAGITVAVGNESFAGNNHKWNGTSYNTYATTANAIGINSQASTPLVDYTSVEQAWLLFSRLTDPDTGLPISVKPDVLLVSPAKYMTAYRIVNQTEVRTTFPEYSATSLSAPGNVQMVSGSPLPKLEVIYSPLLTQLVVASGVTQANANNWWFLTQKKKAFWYLRNWDLTVVPAPPNNIAEFERDIVARWKGSERGVPWSAEPRFITKMYDG